MLPNDTAHRLYFQKQPVAPGSRPTLALRQERHKGTKESVLCLPTSSSGTPGTPAPRPPSGSQLGVSWLGGRAPILVGGGRHGISGHSSAQWPSRFSKGPLGWTLGPPEAQVGSVGPAAHNPMGAPAPFWYPHPHNSLSAPLFSAKATLSWTVATGPPMLSSGPRCLAVIDRALHRRGQPQPGSFDKSDPPEPWFLPPQVALR